MCVDACSFGVYSVHLLDFTYNGFTGIQSKAFTLNFQLPGDKILGLGIFFLAIGIPDSAKGFYSQIEALACLESNR